MKKIVLTGETLNVADIYAIANQQAIVTISDQAREKVRHHRALFEAAVAENIPIYGVTTGYGDLVNVFVDKSNESELQTNLVRSHAAGVGECFTKEEARAIMATRLNVLCRGYSAVTEALIDRLALHLAKDIIPVIPQVGSLGASGDLAPLSHMAVTLLGEGYVFDQAGNKVPTKQLLQQHGITPLKLRFKEGLALINATSAMTGVGSMVLAKAQTQLRQAEIIAALILENQQVNSSPYQAEGHDIAKPHPGQIDCAFNLRALLTGSKLIANHKDLRIKMAEQIRGKVSATEINLQEAYSLRAIPQVIGAIRDTVNYAEKVFGIELNSSSDNPLHFIGQEIFHGANFHGQAIAFAMDYSAIALTQLGVLSERRINRLLNKRLSHGLPAFLIYGDPGLYCGFEGAQYPATALVAENRTICTPASIQSVPANSDNQDVVSMGLIATRNCKRILQNNNYILAVEYLCAAQAIDIAQQSRKLSPAGKLTYDLIRSQVPMVKQDRYMSDDIYQVAKLLDEGKLLANIQEGHINLR